ncbi:MAG: putative Acyl-CoA dehydrogenase [Actinomycetia bacterium]|nr:putative Acyl-CoA dehydrogenase [Actinomycetes bacterium]
MDLLPDARQEALAARARSLVAEADAPVLWDRWAENGWFDGGDGSTLVDHALRFRELGRALVPGPYLATVLARRLVAAVGAVESGVELEAAAVVAALAVPCSPVSVTAVDGSPAGARLRGRLRVLDGTGATHVLLVTPTGAALIEADALPAGDATRCLDPQVALTALTAADVPAALWMGGGDLFTDAAVLAAACASGIAEATLRASTDFAKTREQFGKPIGAFQAVKHRCADMAIRAEAAWCQTAYAALCVDAERSDAAFQAHTAKVVAGDAAIRNASANIQNHGAVGCTVENDAHLFLKRAWVLEEVCGARREHLSALLDLPAPE